MKHAMASIAVTAGGICAVAAGLAALVAGPGVSHGYWGFRTGILVLRWAAFAGLAACALSAIGFVAMFRFGLGRTMLWAILGIGIGFVVAGTGMYWKHIAGGVPRIHDITTDTQDPPVFVAALSLRTASDNPAAYAGGEVTALQQKAYPDIAPLVLAVSTDAAFERAHDAAERLGWQIIDSDRKEGRIEAVDTTFWFRFKDDIVIRVRPQDSGARVDIRSASRVGISDLGKNAQRIRAFLQRMRKDRD